MVAPIIHLHFQYIQVLSWTLQFNGPFCKKNGEIQKFKTTICTLFHVLAFKHLILLCKAGQCSTKMSESKLVELSTLIEIKSLRQTKDKAD